MFKKGKTEEGRPNFYMKEGHVRARWKPGAPGGRDLLPIPAEGEVVLKGWKKTQDCKSHPTFHNVH